MNTILYRPMGPAELDLIKQSGYKKFPPRFSEQPIFYPVLNEQYAAQISKEWNLPAYGAGYVAKFLVDSKYLEKFEIRNVGGEIHNELWIPATQLEEFNSHIVGNIEIIAEFK